MSFIEVDTIIESISNGCLPDNKTIKENWLNNAEKNEQQTSYFRPIVSLDSLPEKANVRNSLLNVSTENWKCNWNNNSSHLYLT